VGVAPRGFGGTDLQPADIWLPVSLVDRAGPGSDWMASRFASWLTVIARLAANVDRQQAAGYATVLLGDVTAGQPPTVFAGGLNGNSAPEEARQRSTLLWVTAAALLVLSIACVNVALLLLARGERRTHEISLRLALGASRWRVVRQLLVESALLALVGMLVGGLSLLWGESVARLLGMPSSAGFVDQQVVIFVAGTALVASFGFGIAPAYQAVRVALRSALSADPERAGGRRSRGKRLLIAAQVALSFMLLVTAATFVATLREAQHIDVGADVDHLLLVSTPASGEGLPIDAAWKLFTTLRDRVVELPGVASAALASAVPFVSTIQVPVRLPDVETSGMALVNNVGLEYRSTIGARLLAGRWFTAADTLSKDPVAIISLQMARQFWPAGGAVGKCFHVSDLSSPCTRVIGVTEDAKYTDVHADPAPLFYLLARGRLTAMPSLLVRTSGGADGSRERIWRSLQESSSSNPYLEVTPFRSLVGTQLLQLRNGSALFLCFALLSLCLSCFGLFGLLSFMVARRSREFGVRQAMGATRKDLIFLVLFDSARTVGAGMICGTLLAVGVVRVLSQSLGLQNVYPIAYLLVMAVLGGAAAVASCIPALRAARTPPAWALRQS
jgi:predicted permease